VYTLRTSTEIEDVKLLFKNNLHYNIIIKVTFEWLNLLDF